MKKVNIAELLKDCPSGMELDCTIFDNVILSRIDLDLECEYPIRIETKNGCLLDLTKYGTYTNEEEAKCVIFPKGKTTWEGFQRPFKDGEILATDLGSVFILKSCPEDKIHYHSYIGVTCCNEIQEQQIPFAYKHVCHLATEEEKQKLFQAIRANGYKWNQETKTLETLIEFEDGDVIANDKFIAIFHKFKDGHMYYHCWYHNGNNSSKFKTDFGIGYIYEYRLASKGEKAKLFQAIKDNGYKWNPESKTLEKLIQPKFKVGDKIRHKENGNILKIVEIDMSDSTYCCGLDYIWVADQDDYELVPNKFDITTLKPFDSRVLVRNADGDLWKPAIYGFSHSKGCYVVGGVYWRQCIPYEENKELLGTTNNLEEYGSR